MTDVKPSPKATAGWVFRGCLRRAAFGWRGTRPAMARIHQALAEIRGVARKDSVLAPEGAVLFLEKISPAVQSVDGSSGALGQAVAAAVEALIPFIASAPVSEQIRERWLDRLFEALQDDDPPYIASLGEVWGDLCVTIDLASRRADQLMLVVKLGADGRRHGAHGWFPGTTACYSAMFRAGRFHEFVDLHAQDRYLIASDLIWGAQACAALGDVNAAVAYIHERAWFSIGASTIASYCDEILLQAGRRDDAYTHYAISACQATTRLGTYRALARRYPEIAPGQMLDDLIASSTGEEGKWFATAKDLGHLDLAIDLAHRSPCDPKTLVRAPAIS